jgi:ATP-binding cassette subfamily B (MDR/TAP) protein 1
MFLVQGQPDWTQDNCREKCLTLTADDCLQVGIYFIILAVSAVFFEMGCAFIFGYIGETITQKLRIEAFTSVVKQSVGFHDAPENTPGSLTADLETKTSKVSKIAGPNIGKQLGMMCGLIMGLTLGFALGNPILALIILGMVPFLMMAMIFVMTLMYVGEVGGASPFSEAGQVSSEAIMNVRTVRALNNEDTVVERFMEICTPISDKSRKNAWKTGLAFGFSQCIFFAIYIAAFGFGALLIEDADQCSNEAAEKGNEVFKTLFCIMFGVIQAGLAASMLPDAMRANVALYDIFKIINRKSDINVFEPNGSRTNINAEVALVAFDNVQFFYPHRPNVQVLKGLTFEVHQGQTAAFCGPSGSGKSTVISLLQRFYDPQGGRVLVGGIDLRKYDISWWRQNIGFVGQEPVLFNLSVEENIRYGKLFDSESITSEQCVAAAKIANCNFITEVHTFSFYMRNF